MNKLINVLNEMFPDTANEVIIIHSDPRTKEPKTMSPMVQATSIGELIQRLVGAREAIQHFINDLTDKQLKSNGQGN